MHRNQILLEKKQKAGDIRARVGFAKFSIQHHKDKARKVEWRINKWYDSAKMASGKGPGVNRSESKFVKKVYNIDGSEIEVPKHPAKKPLRSEGVKRGGSTLGKEP